MALTTVKPPPRHCTNCGIRIWSLTGVRIKNTYAADDWKDLCVDCDTGVPVPDRTARMFRRAAR